jgi:uncharacterized protein YlxW (UPF0749 family)
VARLLLQSIDPDQTAIFAAVLSNGLSKDLTSNKLNILGNFIVAVGSLMLTRAAQEEGKIKQKEDKQPKPDIQQQIEQLQQQLQQLQKEYGQGIR